jgi:hypothetical protein
MTELERARAHLRQRQKYLSAMRKSPLCPDCSPWEMAVLAALSWVWEEQEKSRAEHYRECLEGIFRERFT